tara:strand:- start:1055 stop:1303 length:249 start_codon:yes stop_codon:yes gene_type:complete
MKVPSCDGKPGVVLKENLEFFWSGRSCTFAPKPIGTNVMQAERAARSEKAAPHEMALMEEGTTCRTIPHLNSDIQVLFGNYT